MNKIIFSSRLSTLIKATGLRQEDFAKRTGMELACTFMYYTLARPNEMSFMRIRDFTDMSPSVLISDTISKNKYPRTVMLARLY